MKFQAIRKHNEKVVLNGAEFTCEDEFFVWDIGKLAKKPGTQKLVPTVDIIPCVIEDKPLMRNDKEVTLQLNTKYFDFYECKC